MVPSNPTLESFRHILTEPDWYWRYANALTMIDAKPFGGIMSRVASVMSAHIPLLAAAGVTLAVLSRRHLAQGFSLGRAPCA